MGTIYAPSFANIFKISRKTYLSPNQKQICNIVTLHRQHFYGMD